MVATDGHLANPKCEVNISADNPKRRLLHSLCVAHKKAKVNKLTYDALHPVVSLVNRSALSLEGPPMLRVRAEARRMHTEQVVIIVGGECPLEATAHRLKVYKLYLKEDTPDEKANSALIRKLYNGDIRKVGVIERYENGCCSDPGQTLKLFRQHGCRALLRRRVKPLDTQNWTGSEQGITDQGLRAMAVTFT